MDSEFFLHTKKVPKWIRPPPPTLNPIHTLLFILIDISLDIFESVFIKGMRKNIKGIDDVTISVHGHDDLGDIFL